MGFDYRGELNAKPPTVSRRKVEALLGPHMARYRQRESRSKGQSNGNSGTSAKIPQRTRRMLNDNTKLLCVALRFGSTVDFSSIK